MPYLEKKQDLRNYPKIREHSRFGNHSETTHHKLLSENKAIVSDGNTKTGSQTTPGQIYFR
jgi:hypothetical protein